MRSRVITLSKRLRTVRAACRIVTMSLPAGLGSCPGYQLREFRGRGGFGEVWEGIGPDGERVAVKFIRCDADAAPREIRKLQQIRQIVHPNLPRIDKIFCHSGYLCLVMELAEGSLHDLLEVNVAEGGTNVRPARVCEYLSQAAEVLDFLNARRHRIDGQLVAFRHCDVKPSNLLLKAGVVKLSDFGLAVMTGSPSQRHTQAGTTAYAAPEVFAGNLNDRSDQYSLAVSYFQLRTGKMPFGDSPAQFRGDYVRPAPDVSPLSPREQPILVRALAPFPLDRWASCGEMMAQLTRAVST